MKLFDYQLEGVRWLQGKDLRFHYLADWPGLGKTIQSITAAKEMGVKSVLCLCPAAIVPKWQKDLGGFQRVEVASYDSISPSPPQKHETVCPNHKNPPPPKPSHPTDCAGGPDDRFQVDNKGPWFCRVCSFQYGQRPRCAICGFDYPDKSTIAKKMGAQLLRKRLKAGGPWDLIILDEAHLLKEKGSKRTGYVFNANYGLLTTAHRGFLLSGTPVLNRPAELWTVLRACYPQALHDCPTFESYAYRFCDGGSGWNDSLDAGGASNLDELSKRLAPFMLHRDFSVLGDILPPKTILDHDIEIEQFLSKEEHIATRRRETGEAKIQLLVEDIKRTAEKHGKLVVFYQHKSVLKALQKIFPHAPAITGGLTGHQKEIQIDRFKKLALSPVMLVQLGAGGTGLDGLQHCTDAGYVAELDWTPALIDQAIGRIWRIGQKNPVTIYRPIGRKQGLDSHMHNLLAEKTLVIADVMQHVTKNIVEVVKENLVDQVQFGEAISGHLSRIADALEALAVQGGTSAQEPKKANKKTASKSEVIPEVQEQPAPDVLTVTKAKEIINQELIADPNDSARRFDLLDALFKSYGIDNKDLEKLKPADLPGFVEAALSKFAQAPEPKAAPSYAL
jgi:hypothetical protein